LEVAVQFGLLDMNPRNSDDKDNPGRLYYTTNNVSPRFFFPKERFGIYDDDLSKNNPEEHICMISEEAQLKGEINVPPTFYLEGQENMRKWALDEMDEYRRSLPLTLDDFILPQYT
jgi:hypothetical protein